MPSSSRLLWLPVLRAHLGLLALMVACLQRAWGAYPPHLLEQVRHPEDLRRTLEQNEISRFEASFAPLKPLLPSHGDLGYLSAVPSERLFQEGDLRTYYLTQYTLAPLRVLNTQDLPRLVRTVPGATPSLPAAYTPLSASRQGPALYEVSR